jgi:hypothetical protein
MQLAKSDTVKNIKTKVEDSVGYFYGKLFGNNYQSNNNSKDENEIEKKQEDVLIENIYTKP